MRLIFLAAVIVGCLAGAVSGADEKGASVGDLGAADRLVINGCRAVDAKDVKSAILLRWQVQLAATPTAPLADYVSTVQQQVELGYRASGFPSAKVSARVYNGRVVVDVTEGPRLRRGGIQVEGDTDVSTKDLTGLLTSPPPIGTFRHWSDERGIFHVSMERQQYAQDAPWKEDEWAAFDLASVKQLHTHIADALSNLGFLTAKFDHEIGVENDKAVLRIRIKDAGPRASVGEINFSGLKKNKRENILKFLDLREGEPVGLRELLAAQQRLWDSGRFKKHVITVEPGPAVPTDLHVHFAMEENPDLPPLSEPLEATDQAMLACLQWMLGRVAAGDELILDFQSDSPAMPVSFHSVVGKQGGAFRIGVRWGQNADASTQPASQPTVVPAEYAVAVTGNFAGLYSFSNARKLTVTRSKPFGGTITMVESLVVEPSGEAKSALNVSASVDSNRRSLELALDVPPYEFAGLLHKTGAKAVIHDGVMTVSGGKVQARVEVPGGRLLEGRLDLGDYHVRLECRHGALAEEIDALNRIDPGKNVYDPKRPLGSLVAFVAGEAVNAPPVASRLFGSDAARAPQVLTSLLTPDIFEPADTILNSLSAGGESDFGIPPGDDSTGGWLDTILYVLPATDAMFDRGSWPWTLTRQEVLLITGHNQWLPSEAQRILESGGPLCHLMSAQFIGQYNKAAASNIARRGLAFMDAKDFHKDVHALVEGNGVVAQSLRRLAQRVRSMPQADFYALADSLPKTSSTLLRRLRFELTARQDQPIDKALPAALDAMWPFLHDPVESALRAMSPVPLGVP